MMNKMNISSAKFFWAGRAPINSNNNEGGHRHVGRNQDGEHSQTSFAKQPGPEHPWPYTRQDSPTINMIVWLPMRAPPPPHGPTVDDRAALRTPNGAPGVAKPMALGDGRPQRHDTPHYNECARAVIR